MNVAQKSATFLIIGPHGDLAYKQSKVIAKHIRKAVRDGAV